MQSRERSPVSRSASRQTAARTLSVQRGLAVGEEVESSLQHCCQVSSSSAAGGAAGDGAGMEGPTFRVKPVALLVNLTLGPGPGAELKGTPGLFPSWPGLLPPSAPEGLEPAGRVGARQGQLQKRRRKETALRTLPILQTGNRDSERLADGESCWGSRGPIQHALRRVQCRCCVRPCAPHLSLPETLER